MRILLLSQYFPPEIGSAAAKMAEMADFMQRRGHQVEVVSQIPCYPQGVVYHGYEGAWFRRESRDGMRINALGRMLLPSEAALNPGWPIMRALWALPWQACWPAPVPT